jgi:hypothetical protein
MKDLHQILLYVAYIIFFIALAWDYISPNIVYKKTLRHVVLKSMKKKSTP